MGYPRLLFVFALPAALPVHVALKHEGSASTRAAQLRPPATKGHFLTNSELANITAVACLEAKIRNPAVQCTGEGSATLTGQKYVGHLSVGNFPSYKDVACNGGGEFFCDPTAIFTTDQRKLIEEELTKQRRANPVMCGHLLNDKVDPRHLQPFYLGVIVLNRWHLGASDPDSLQQFGQVIAADWDMDDLYLGDPPSYYLKCPTTAMLIILPDHRQAYLSAASCEYLCSSRGGPEVVTAVRSTLAKEGATEAVLAGIKAAYHALKVSPATSEAVVVSSVARQKSHEFRQETSSSNALQRLVFFAAVVGFVVSLALGLLFLLLAPGIVARGRKR